MRLERLKRYGLELGALLVALLLCSSRLTHTLGYEHAFLSGLLMSLIGGHLGVRAAEPRVWEQLWGRWWRVGLSASRIALIPLGVGALNGARVGSCDALEGLGYYVILPFITCWVASGWGVVTGALGRGFGSYLLAYLASLLYVGAQVWWTPIIDPFHPLFGYYPGAIYDELLMVDGRLWWSRVEDLLWPLTAVAILSWRAQPQSALRGRLAGLMALSLLGGWLFGNSLDLRRTHRHVQAQLGGRYETAHMNIYYPSKWEDRRVQRLAMELEFLYQELSIFFGHGTSQKISAYLYASARQKKRLMGAARTRVAKPWQYSIHVHAPAIGQSVIKHELAHAFSADIAPAPHHLSLYRGLFPHMPLIEGLAEAATWSEGALTPHQLTAALRQEGVAPPLEGLLSPQGFYLSSSRISYTMCGSFVRFFRTERGQAELAELYASGGQSALSGQAELIKRWEEHIDAIELNPQERRVVAQLLNQPSIFYKVCAHEVAEVRGQAQGAVTREAWEEALSLWRQLRQFSVGDRGAIYGEVRALFKLKRWEALSALLEAELKTSDLPLKLRLEEWSLDLGWLREEVEEVSVEVLQRTIEGYAALLTQLPSRADRRRVSVKRSCAQRDLLRSSTRAVSASVTRAGQRVARLLLDPASASPSYREALDQVAGELPEPWETLTYLRARAEMITGDEARAIELLQTALDAPLSEPDLRYESERLIAEMMFFERDASPEQLRAVSARFNELSQRSAFKLTEGERASLLEWSRRASWFATHQLTTESTSGVKLKP